VSKRVVLTGGPGFGKSSIIAEIEQRGFYIFPEVARALIQKVVIPEVSSNAPAFYPDDFANKIISERIKQFNEAPDGWSFYDRAVPDVIGFLRKDKKAIPYETQDVCIKLRYHSHVFITPPWEAIYQKDTERREDFRAAVKVHKALEEVYTQLGYTLIAVPMGSIKQRADFVLKHLLLI